MPLTLFGRVKALTIVSLQTDALSIVTVVVRLWLKAKKALVCKLSQAWNVGPEVILQ